MDSSNPTVVVCDSNAASQKALAQSLRRYFEDICSDTAVVCKGDGASLLSASEHSEFDFVFIDTKLKDAEGLAVAKSLRSRGYVGQIAFTSTSGDDALNCFAVHPAGFFTKPVDYPKLCDMLNWHKSIFTAGLRVVSVVSSRIRVNIYLRDIMSVEANGRTLVIHTANSDISTNMALSELESQLNGLPFMRCHRSHIANLRHAKGLDKKALVMQYGPNVPVSTEKAACVEAALKDFLR